MTIKERKKLRGIGQDVEILKITLIGAEYVKYHGLSGKQLSGPQKVKTHSSHVSQKFY